MPVAALPLLCSFVALVCMLGSAQVPAQTIYKWVDEEGGTHYSENPPASELSSLEALDVVTRDPSLHPAATAADYSSTLELANMLQAGRLERERLRLEQQKLAQRNRQTQLEEQNYYDAYRSPVYYGPYYRFPRDRQPHHGNHPGNGKPPGYGQRPRPKPYSGRPVQKRVYIDRR